MIIKWTHIIIHHSESPDKGLLDWQEIRKWHKAKGWKDIGYHYGVEKINDEYEILIGRSLRMEGAHCQGMNSKAIGICCVGNFDKIAPSEKLLDKLRILIKDLQLIFNIPDTNILPHRDFSDKTCPGVNFDMSFL